MSRIFSIVEDWIPAILLGVMTLIVIVDVAGRYVLSFTVPGAAEVATALFIWLIFLGSAGAVRRMQHISIDTFTNILPVRLRPWLQLVIAALILVGSLYIIRLGIILMTASWHREIEVVHVSYFYIYLVVPISFTLMAIHAAAHVYDLLRNWENAACVRTQHDPELEI